MLILDGYKNMWDYTFVAFALFSLAIGTIITIRKMKKEELNKRKEKRSENNDQNN